LWYRHPSLPPSDTACMSTHTHTRRQRSQLHPADVPVEDLLFVAPTVTSIHHVVIELQNRLHGHLRLQVELAKLSQRYAHRPHTHSPALGTDSCSIMLSLVSCSQVWHRGHRRAGDCRYVQHWHDVVRRATSSLRALVQTMSQ
jgi:hypothetical protein